MVVTISLLILWSWYSSKLLSKSSPSLPPGPYHLPILGYLPFLGRNLHTQFTDMAQTYGPIFKIRVGTKLYIVINTPELAKTVVRDQDVTFANRSLTVVATISSYEGQDIAWSSYNASWRKLRKVFAHEVLSNKNLKATSSFRRDEVRKNRQECL
ncbi:hypothetical protein L6452_24003 [Arctium lappa]|uniref:Uncharacterized protein n=1 Tax=Arctium lappa TaxID=4217 RepID=A0ACB9A961_ARCLA|nr:hypothetical protein L6452_24003 [Arctium lappa]